MNFTGKASIDKPWLNFYPEGLRNLDVPKITRRLVRARIIFKNEKPR